MESKHLPSEKLLTPREVPDTATPTLRTPGRRWRSSSHFHEPHRFGTVSKRRSRVNVVRVQLNLASNELFHILVAETKQLPDSHRGNPRFRCGRVILYPVNRNIEP